VVLESERCFRISGGPAVLSDLCVRGGATLNGTLSAPHTRENQTGIEISSPTTEVVPDKGT
jgi:hypothetical protein